MSISTISRQLQRQVQDADPTPEPAETPGARSASHHHLRAVPNQARHTGTRNRTAGPAGPDRTAFLNPPRTVSENLGVPTLHRTVVDYANFDHAASTPALESVKTAVDVALRTYSSVHRGNGYASRITSGWYEQARAQVHGFVGARADDLAIFTRNSTDSLNLLARSLPENTTTFVFESEHHAALLSWDPARTVRIPVPGNVQDALTLLEEALRTCAEGSTEASPRLVVITGASNVTGELWPVESVVTIAKRYGARVALDAAQLVPHKKVDIESLGVDYVVFSGHKLYAPFGAGVLAGRADWLNQAAPYLRGGGATAKVTNDQTVWTQGAARHEAGSPNVVGAIAIAAACAAFDTHRTAIEAHEEALAQKLRAGLSAMDGVKTYSIFGPEHDRVGVTCFTIDGIDSSLVSAVLSAEYGIGVRDGKFCAHLLVEALLHQGEDSPETAVRASVGLANNAEHVNRLLGAIDTLAHQGPAFEYELTPQGWVPLNDPRDLTLPRPW